MDWSVEEKDQIKLERLQSTLNRAFKNVPFHRNRMMEAGASPDDMKRLGDIAALPFMDRSLLSDHYPYGLFAVPLRDIVRIHTSPGTGRNPTITGYTHTDLAVWKTMVERSYAAAGMGSADIIQINLPPGLANWGRDYKDGGESLGASVIPNASLSLSKTLMVARDYRTTTLVTTPVFASHFADHLFLSGCNPNELTLKRIILVGEPSEPGLAAALEENLHVDVRQHYGLSEIPGPAIAHECRERTFLHISDDHLLPEVIDPSTGNLLGPGEAGELVLTTLSARAFPLIRFRTGDRVRLLNEPCSCGSPLLRIEWLTPRVDELMVVSGIKVAPAQVITLLKELLGHDRALVRLERRKKAGQDWLEIRLAVDDYLFSDAIKELEKLMDATGELLSERLGVKVRVRLSESY